MNHTIKHLTVIYFLFIKNPKTTQNQILEQAFLYAKIKPETDNYYLTPGYI